MLPEKKINVINIATISERERARRRASIESAQGSVRLEGFILDADIVALNEKFINGELDRQQLGAAIRAAVGV